MTPVPLVLASASPRRQEMLRRAIRPARSGTIIGVVGKYMGLQDSYKSIYEALRHAGISNDAGLVIRGIEAEELESGDSSSLDGVHGILVPGGFGNRGIEGKVAAVEYARTRRIPFLGICLGMQCAVMETARNVAGLAGANSAEFDGETPHPVIDLMEGQRGVTRKGATMRLGAYPCVIAPGSRAEAAYGTLEISERHRHRYEVNNDYRRTLEEAGMVCTGLSPDGSLVEIVERPDHPWFVACQFHPEFKSRPLEPGPLFAGFVAAAIRYAGV